MFGTVAASGIRTLSTVSFADNRNLIVVAVSLGIGLIPVAVPTVYDEFPLWFRTIMSSGISAGCVAAILLNVFFNHTRRDEPQAAAP